MLNINLEQKKNNFKVDGYSVETKITKFLECFVRNLLTLTI